ncbi:hypothetical protein [Thiohalobacter thiocyanaticus]|uniref:Uncharacterized protein n=1 Tax=Thiohalobacter thiocyanaticus TaxID=585455 RepID=A0A426QIH4_9GAMM|nr:hypothetical protein [Thiohalobacter thiocyanaticus]RRQ21561.1 hypothetical protein D6C00_06155 [Thiohalobacter thiocyanaticus]
MFMFEPRDIGWWYWLATVILLSVGLAGWPQAFALAIALTVLQLLHYMLREKSIEAFPVQVRIGYLLLLLLAWPEPLQWIYWIPAIGTWAQVIFGYCTMARLVSLLPWNRRETFSWALVRRTFLSPPVRGNVLQGHAPLD